MQERETNPTAGPVAGQHQSLAFRQLLNALSGGEKKRVLDLGSAIGGNVSFFSQFSCKLFITDLYPNLRAAEIAGPAESRTGFDRLVERLLPLGETAPVDFILAWDLLNYLELYQIGILTEKMTPLCHDQTLLFSMISTLKEIPDRPLQYEIQDSQTLSYTSDPRLRRPCPRYKEPDLERAMKSFSVETSFLLRNGTQEYLFAFTPQESAQPEGQNAG